MNFINAIIVLALIFGGFIGWKHGFVKQVISVVGLFVVVIISYLLKNPISKVFYKFLPFIHYGGTFKNVSSINILIYEIIAFAIAFSILYTGFKILVGTTSIIKKVLNANRKLGTHSNILGALFGVIEAYLLLFIGLYILSLPLFNIKQLSESSMANSILDNTPVLSYVIDDKLTLYEEINELKLNYAQDDDHTELDRKLLKLLVDNKVISMDNVYELINQGKIDYKLIEEEKEDNKETTSNKANNKTVSNKTTKK